MSAVVRIQQAAGGHSGMITEVEANPAAVLVDSEKFDQLYEEMEREVRTHVPDLTTLVGRKAIGSLAYKIARTKTAIDEAGKKLTEDKRSEIKIVDAARKAIRDRLDDLRDSARQPLTDWEAAEDRRIDAMKRLLSEVKKAGIVSLGDTLAAVNGRIDMLSAIDVTPEDHQEFAGEIRDEINRSRATLTSAIERMEREEAERAELAKLRAEAAERIRSEEQREAAIAEARHAEAAIRAQAEKQAQAKAEEQRRIAEAQEAARREAIAAAERREQEAAAAHAAEIKRMKDEQDARDREAARVAQAAADAERAEKEEAARRAADREHRGSIMGEAKDALMDGHGLSETKAKAIVLAIAAGNIPHTSIRF